MLQLLQLPLFTSVLCVIVFTYVARFLAKGYTVRSRSRNLPGPPKHSWLFGHLVEVGAVAASYPRRVHPHVYPTKIQRTHSLGSFFVIDVWPTGDPMIAVMDPAVCQQFSVEYNTRKHEAMKQYLLPLVGPDDMVSSNGQLWHKWRRIFNPGFSTQHLMTLVPGIVDDVQIYVDKLNEHADDGKAFRLEEDTTRLTVDVIGRVTLDLHFNMQRGDNVCVQALREQVHLLPNEGWLNPMEMLHPWGIYRRWANKRIMEDYIGKVLDDHFATAESRAAKKQRRRTVIDLALDSYVSGVEADPDHTSSEASTAKMDAEFRRGAITQIRTFLFAGHDTTSSTMCYMFYLLKKHPECQRKICLEHEDVFGPLENTADAIKRQPHLLNRLEYTMCVIKETLRLFPPASAPRAGEPGLMLRDPKTGENYSTEGFMIWLVHYGLGRNKEVWGETVDQFDPSRFLPENASKIPDGAWRPFEMGTKNCLGQNLAVLEMKIIASLICRQFEFEPALDAIEELKKDGSYYAMKNAFRQGPQNVDGEKMYQTLLGAAKPREGMPVRVRRLI